MIIKCRNDHEKLHSCYDERFTRYLIVRAPRAPVHAHIESGVTVSATGVQEGAEEREKHAMLTYVVKDMPTELYTELLEGLRMPGQVLSDYPLNFLA
jgi:hypothetical protein